MILLLVLGLCTASIGQLSNKYKDKIEQKLKKLKAKMIWSGTIRSMLISYFQLCLLAQSKLETFIKYKDSPGVRNESDFQGGIGLFLAALLIPISIIIVILRN